VFACLIEKDICDDTIVDVAAGRRLAVDKSAIGVSAPPKVNSRRISVHPDQLGGRHLGMVVGKVVVMASGLDQRRTGSQEGDSLGPDVFKRLNLKEVSGRNQGVVGVSTIVERDEHIFDLCAKAVPDLTGEDKKEGDVGEEGGDEGIEIDDAVTDTEALDEMFAAADANVCFREGRSPDIVQGDLCSNRDSKVSGTLTNAEGGPW